MDLSLRDVIVKRYGYLITGNFSFINEVFRLAKQEVSEGVYRTADGGISLRSLLSALVSLPPLPQLIVLDFKVSPQKITVGDSATISWQVQSPSPQDTKIWLIAQGQSSTQFWRKDNLPLAGAIRDTPMVWTLYSLTAEIPKRAIAAADTRIDVTP